MQLNRGGKEAEEGPIKGYEGRNIAEKGVYTCFQKSWDFVEQKFLNQKASCLVYPEAPEAQVS